MYAIVESRGRQYRVTPGEMVALDLFEAKPGDAYTFDRVLMLVGEDNKIIVDREELNKVRVSGIVTGDAKGEKIIAFKYKKRKDYHRKVGHRQKYTMVKVAGIDR